MSISYNPIHMCMGKDGKLSLTRTAACTAHLLFAVTVGWLTYEKQEFLFDMWSLYIGVAVFHASYDKSFAMIADLKRDKVEPPKE